MSHTLLFPLVSYQNRNLHIIKQTRGSSASVKTPHSSCVLTMLWVLSPVFKKQKVHKSVFSSVIRSLQIPLQLVSNSWHSCMRVTKPTFKENKLAGKPCWLGGGGELGTQGFQSATHFDDRVEMGQCNDLVEQKGLSVFTREQLVWVTGSVMTPGCMNS